MSGPADARPTWATVLDEYASVLDRQAAMLADPDRAPTTVDAFVPPSGLGPVPEALRDRATALAVRTRELTEEAERQLARTPAPTRRPHSRRRPTTFDQRA